MFKVILVIATFTLLFSSKILANDPELTGNQIYNLCKKDELVCTTYINGWLGGYHVGQALLANTLKISTMPATICFPKGSNIIQFKDVFISYLDNNPEQRHERADILVAASLKLAFPCQ